jgi:hypothetical protein
MVLIVDDKGELVAAQQAHHVQGGPEAGLRAGPGQRLHEVDVPDEVAALGEPQQFLAKIKAHIPRG